MYVFICIYHILCMYLSYSMYVYIIISSNTLIRPITDINTLTDNCFACSLLCNFWLLANDKMGDPWPYPIAGSPSILWGASEALHLKAGWRIAGWRGRLKQDGKLGIAQQHVLSAIKGCGGYAVYAMVLARPRKCQSVGCEKTLCFVHAGSQQCLRRPLLE